MELFHVTLTKNAASIRKNGITHFNPSNWIKAGSKERYGKGDIYAFEHEKDAHRWAGKMDWDLHQTLGSGKISVVRFKSNIEQWKQDKNDVLSQAGSKGKWLYSSHPVKPEDIKDIYTMKSEHFKRLATMNELTESIVENNLAQSNELFRSIMADIAEKKLFEMKKMVAASFFGGSQTEDVHEGRRKSLLSLENLENQ